MESVGAFDAKTRLSELLDRAAKGETFKITKHGQVMARLGPDEGGFDRQKAVAAAERLKGFRGAMKGLSVDDLIDSIHEGHRF